MGRRRQDPDAAPQATLSTGAVARIVRSDLTDGFEVVIDGTPQSHVDPDDPTHLHFEYVARMAAVIDQLRVPGLPLTAVHLGGGGMTIPRYIARTRPGSRQQVIELEQALVDLVRRELPLPRGAAIRVRIGDARAVLGRLPTAMRGATDLVVSDVFAGARTPAHLTTVEFYREASALLTPDGMLLVNVADGAGLAFARRQVATVRAVLAHVMVLAEAQTLKGRRFGNLVIAASATPPPRDRLPRLMAAGPFPAQVLDGTGLDAFTGRLPPVTDADAAASPAPPPGLFSR